MGLFRKRVNGYVIKRGADLSGANLINANLRDTNGSALSLVDIDL